MRLVRLFDTALRFCGIGLIRIKSPQHTWTPRFNSNGEIYMWLRNE